MPELAHLSTTGPLHRGDAILRIPAMSGWPVKQDLDLNDLSINGGPTGRSVYWLDWFSVLHPAYATTDAAENKVDLVWFDQPAQPVVVAYTIRDRDGLDLATTVAEIRDMLDLPVAEIAKICGVHRRQLYNLLNGRSTTTEREARIRQIHRLLKRLFVAAQEERRRLRAALLLPIDDQKSLFDALKAGDIGALGGMCEELERRLASGFEGRIRRSLGASRVKEG